LRDLVSIDINDGCWLGSHGRYHTERRWLAEPSAPDEIAI